MNTINYSKLHWIGDNKGDEVGYDDIDDVGTYVIPDTKVQVRIDTETHKVLDAFIHVGDGDSDTDYIAFNQDEFPMILEKMKQLGIIV